MYIYQMCNLLTVRSITNLVSKASSAEIFQFDNVWLLVVCNMYLQKTWLCYMLIKIFINKVKCVY